MCLLQKALARKVAASPRERLRPALPAANLALTRIVGGPGAGHWALLSNDPANLLEDSLFAAAARSRLGLSVGASSTCRNLSVGGQACARLLDQVGQHARPCPTEHPLLRSPSEVGFAR